MNIRCLISFSILIILTSTSCWSAAELSLADKKLFNAIASRDTDMLTEALDEGADPNAINPLGKIALTWAIETGPAKIIIIIEQLLNRKANTNKTDMRNFTPLMIAAKENNVHAVQALLDGDADRNLINNRGLTALDVAQQTMEHKKNIYIQYKDHYTYRAWSTATEIVTMLKLGK